MNRRESVPEFGENMRSRFVNKYVPRMPFAQKHCPKLKTQCNTHSDFRKRMPYQVLSLHSQPLLHCVHCFTCHWQQFDPSYHLRKFASTFTYLTNLVSNVLVDELLPIFDGVQLWVWYSRDFVEECLRTIGDGVVQGFALRV